MENHILRGGAEKELQFFKIPGISRNHPFFDFSGLFLTLLSDFIILFLTQSLLFLLKSY